MKQSTIVAGIIALLAIVFGLWYFMSPATTTDDQMMATTTTTTTGTTGTNTTGTTPKKTPVTFKSIFAQTANTQCDYAQTDTNSNGASVIYISGGKMHGEFRADINGAKTASIMIYNGGYLYSWKEGATVGTKASIKSLADLPAVIPTDLTSGAILGTGSENVSWNCHAWNTDPKMFVLPTYVTFK